MLAAKSSQQVDKINREGEMNQMAKATETKATQANKPTEEKFLSAKDIAVMAKVKPTVLRRCLRQHFAGRVSTVKNGIGLKVYQIKAEDPIVKEILAKLKGNGSKSATPVKAEAKKEAKVKAKQEQALARLETETPPEEPPAVSPPFTEEETTDEGEGDKPSPNSPSRIEDFDSIYGGKDSREKMEKLVAQAHSEAK